MDTMRKPKPAIESGVVELEPHLHPTQIKNYGKWKWHDRPRPGVLRHVAESGDELFTVRVGTQRQLDVFTIRKLCDIADKFCDGHLRFTMRANVEFMTPNPDNVDLIIAACQDSGFPVGGTGPSVKMISHTQGWLHCDIPGTDASGVVKSLMDELYEEFTNERMPNRVNITTSCCEINCGGQGDIAVNVQHTKPPKINHDLVANACERPTVVARCPVAAIRPAMVNGKPSLEVDEKKCVACGACYPPCPPMQINDPEHTKIAIWIGGKHSNARSKPTLHKLAISNLPNNPPRWPEVSAIVMRILRTYQENARDWERLGEWVERIGWKQFFELTGIPFTKYHIDDFNPNQSSLNNSAHIRL